MATHRFYEILAFKFQHFSILNIRIETDAS